MKLSDTPINPFTGAGTEGMTLRQYYAGLMMAAYRSRHDLDEISSMDVAKWSLDDANALLAELEKEQGNE